MWSARRRSDSVARVESVFAVGFVAIALLVLVWHNLRENDGGVVYVKVTNRASQPRS